ncbi:hypothetical protein [Silicimonas algicola]|uniref:hypothetical protein n=1 Tax=Silicimonas algicola TaxID=1826607 RepID=UPI0011B1FE50|nr:hypothetical protein [Silicimonas algicola]
MLFGRGTMVGQVQLGTFWAAMLHAIWLGMALALILPHRSIPWVQGLAVWLGRGAAFFLMTLSMLLYLLLVQIAGISIWIEVALGFAFALTFLVPGLVFRNLVIDPEKDRLLGRGVLGQGVREELQAASKPTRRLFLGLEFVFILGIVSPFFGFRTVPSQFWASLSVAATLATTAAFVSLFYALSVRWARRTIPRNVRASTYFSLCMLLLSSIPLAAFSYFFFASLVPVAAAAAWGRDYSEVATISSISLNRSRCRESISVHLETGSATFCHLSRRLSRPLSVGDRIVLSGHATEFGIWIRDVDVAD